MNFRVERMTFIPNILLKKFYLYKLGYPLFTRYETIRKNGKKENGKLSSLINMLSFFLVIPRYVINKTR